MNENNTEHNSFLMCQNNVKFIFYISKAAKYYNHKSSPILEF